MYISPAGPALLRCGSHRYSSSLAKLSSSSSLYLTLKTFASSSRPHIRNPRTTIPTFQLPSLPAAKQLFSSTAPIMGSIAKSTTTQTFLEAVVGRRSRYDLNSTSPISDARIQEILRTTIQTVPSAFNTQSARYVVLLNDDHRALWDIVLELLQPHFTDANREGSTQRINGFRNAHGTVLFYEDPAPVAAKKAALPRYADKMDQWSEHTSAMNQFAVWTALSAEGFGANLQHYHPLMNDRVAEKWGVPKAWNLTAQLVFGGRNDEAAPEPKPKEDVSKKMFVHGAEA